MCPTCNRPTVRTDDMWRPLSPGAMTAYLERHGWERQGGGDFADLWRRPEDGGKRVLVPKLPEAVDYERRMGELLSDLRTFEHRTMVEILSELERIETECQAPGPRKTLDELAAEQGIGPVQSGEELAAPLEHRLTDAEWQAWQDAIHGRNGTIGDRYAEDSPYARLKAYADGADAVPSPGDVLELLGAFNATDSMNRVGARTASNHRRRIAALAVLADTDLPIDPEALRRVLAIGTRTEHAPAHPSTAALRSRVAELETQLEDAREELEFLQRRATEH